MRAYKSYYELLKAVYNTPNHRKIAEKIEWVVESATLPFSTKYKEEIERIIWAFNGAYEREIPREYRTEAWYDERNGETLWFWENQLSQCLDELNKNAETLNAFIISTFPNFNNSSFKFWWHFIQEPTHPKTLSLIISQRRMRLELYGKRDMISAEAFLSIVCEKLSLFPHRIIINIDDIYIHDCELTEKLLKKYEDYDFDILDMSIEPKQAAYFRKTNKLNQHIFTCTKLTHI